MIDSLHNTAIGKTRWGILADDLTGAMDVAASFADHGFDVDVVLNGRLRSVPTADIVVLSTDSRNVGPTTAQQLVEKGLKRLDRWEASLFYKKIDSTCKGNVAAEIDAIAKKLDRHFALCPANLPQGRAIRRGWLIVHGRRLLDVQDLLRRQGAGLVRVIANRNAIDWEKSTSEHPEDCLLVDVERPAQMTRLAHWAYQNRERILLIGSANVAGSLARELANDNAPTQPRRKLLPGTLCNGDSRDFITASASELPVVVWSGSRSPVNDRQITYLKKHGRVVEVAFNRAGAIKAQRAIDKKCDVLISIPTHQRPASDIQQRLQNFARSIHREQVAGHLICGGDTACAVLKSLRPGAVRVFGELASGLAWGRLSRGPAGGLLLCTKPGGFGTADALMIAARSMRILSRSRGNPKTSRQPMHRNPNV